MDESASADDTDGAAAESSLLEVVEQLHRDGIDIRRHGMFAPTQQRCKPQPRAGRARVVLFVVGLLTGLLQQAAAG